MPKVSIITASYNYENYIKETIQSVLNQTYTDWEMIIVDDGSKDNSIEVIKSYCEKDNRIKLFTHENNQNKGLIETVKLGVSKANSDWIIFLESDDTITPNYIQEKLKALETYPNVKFFFNDINIFGDEERIADYNKYYFESWHQVLNDLKFPSNVIFQFKYRNFVPTFSCVMLHKDTLQNLDWNAIDKRCLDYYIWAQIARKFDFYYVDKKLTNWRLHKNSYIQKKPENELELIYFNKIQIQDLIQNKFKNRIKYVMEVFKYYRKKIVKLRFGKDEKRLEIFGYKIIGD